MSTFILVHGAWHGAWCWYKVAPRLEQAGHRVVAPDSPSLGADSTPASTVTLDLWVDGLCQTIDEHTGPTDSPSERHESEPVVLVGHSRGGILVQRASELRAPRIQRSIYVAAFLLENNQTVADIAKADQNSRLRPYLVLDENRPPCATIKEEGLRGAFYQDCSEEDTFLARHLLRPEALVTHSTPISVTESNFGRVPRSYIFCEQDWTISPSMQRKMVERTPCEKTVSLNSGHSPFFSQPEALAEHLLALAD